MYKENGNGLAATANGFFAGASAYAGHGAGMTVTAGQEIVTNPSDWWARMFAGQDRFLQQVLGGYNDMESGFGEMLAGFLNSGNATFDQLAGNLARMGSSLLGGLVQTGGPLGGIAGSINSALGFLGPVGSFLSTGLSLFKGIKSLFGGGKVRRLSSPLADFSSYQAPQAAAPDSQSSRTVNVYINGQGLKSAVEVDRTLGRAGVDRNLRDQIKELVRSGSNPAA